MPTLLLAAALAPCPKTPNCVSSLAADDDHRVEPLLYTGDPDAAWERLQAVLRGVERLRVGRTRPGYLHAVATSKLLRFKDDVEFSLDAANGRIDVRSCSRTGRYDFGVNRKRVEAIRLAFNG